MSLLRHLAPSLTIALALSLPAAALAGTGGSTSSTAGSGGTGGGDVDCNVASQEQSGTTCQLCMATAGDTQSCQDEFGADYTFACQSTATEQVWCNGPARYEMASTGCALRAVPPEGVGGAAFAVLAALGVYAVRRRNRG
jgi:hypothetical protein